MSPDTGSQIKSRLVQSSLQSQSCTQTARTSFRRSEEPVNSLEEEACVGLARKTLRRHSVTESGGGRDVKVSNVIVLLGLVALACSNDSKSAKGNDGGPTTTAGGSNAGGAAGRTGGTSSASGGQAGARADASMPTTGTGGTRTDAGPPPCSAKAIRCNGMCVDATMTTSGNCTLFTEVDGVESMAVADSGDVYLARRTEFEASIVHVPPTGGGATTLETEDVAVEAMLVDDTNVYFETHLETSTKYQRVTGSIGAVPRAGGAVRWLVRDIPDGVFRKTASHFYVGAQQISPGIRRFDLDGTNEKLLSTVQVQNFVVGTNEIYVLQDFGSPVTELPLDGGDAGSKDAGALLHVLGGVGCDTFIGMDAQALYMECGYFKRIALADGTMTMIAPRPTNAQPFAFDGAYIYYAYSLGRLPQTIERVPLGGGPPEKVAQVDGNQPIVKMVAAGGALYVLANLGLNIVQPFPGFVLKITPPK